MITKTLSGISMLDDPHGGVFSNRSFLVTGAKHAGKTVMGLQFTRQGLEQNERCLYLSTMVADDLGILAESLGFDLTPHLASEALTLLEYESFMSGNGAPGLDMLPPEGFEQLKNMINANSVERVVLDTVLPWVSVRQPDRMAEQVFSFTRSFDRLGVTTMLTLPKPVSSLAYRLKKSIEDIVPISVLLQPPKEEEPALLQVVKYLGEKKLDGKRPFLIQDGLGIRELTGEELLELDPPGTGEKDPVDELEAPPAEKTRPALADPGRPSVRIHNTHRPRFSTIKFDHTRDSEPGRSSQPRAHLSDVEPLPRDPGPAPNLTARQEPAPPPSVSEPAPPGDGRASSASAARLSSIWKPQPESGGSPNPSA